MLSRPNAPTASTGVRWDFHSIQDAGDFPVTETLPTKFLHWVDHFLLPYLISNEPTNDFLAEPQIAARSEIIAATAYDDEEAVEAYLDALRDVAIAHGIASVSKKAHLGRESLYKALSKTGNPKIAMLAMLLKTMGFKLSIEVKPGKRKRAS